MPRLLDLITDARDGRLSANKLWFNAGNAAMTAAFLRHAWQDGLTPELLGVYGAVVAGNNVATTFMRSKYAKRPSSRPADPPDGA